MLKGHNKMRVFQEEIFGPVLAVTTFKDEAEALEIANDTLYGLGAGVWTRDGSRAFRMGRAIKAGRVWTNCYHHYPAHAAFGGYKSSGRRAREPPDDARPLLADQVPAGQLRPQPDGVLLRWSRDSRQRPRAATPAALEVIRSPRGRPRAARVLPVGGLLRRHLPDLPQGRRASGRAARRPAWGTIGGAPFYIDSDQYERWGKPRFLIDVAPGAAEGFSLEGLDGVHFISRTP